MPVTIQGNNSSTNVRNDKKREKLRRSLADVNYDYDYPKGLDLKPGSDTHDFLRDEILARARASATKMKRRHPEWRSIDRVLKAYVPADSDENESIPQIVIPQSFATLETLLTFFSAAFLQSPIFSYDGQGPEDVLGANLLTKVIELQNKKFNNGLALHTQWRDSFAYGIGAITPVWERRMGYKTIKEELGFFSSLRNQFIRTGEEQRAKSEWSVLFEGNKLVNIDPYNLLPDTNVSAHEVQESEYFGWIDPTNFMELRNRERDKSDFIFNARYLRHFTPATNILNDSRRGGTDKGISDRTNPADVIWMYIDIIPSEWELGSKDFPEKWLFGLGGDEVIIAAKPLDLDHNMIPATVASPDYDGYSSNPISRLGIIHDLQYLGDFLYSSHIHNIKKVINDMFVVDPSLINIYDVNDSRPGKIMRIRRKGWGRGVLNDAVQQLNVSDVTTNHVGDAQLLANLMQETSGATDSLRGSHRNRTSRISASEFQGIRSSSLSRLEKAVRVVSMQSMNPLANMMASQTQQLIENETYVKMTGEWLQTLRERFNIQPENELEIDKERAKVDPMDLIVNYDVLSETGDIPGSQDPNVWFQVFQTLGQSPELQQEFSITKVFEHLVTQLGAKNIEQFKKAVTNAPAPTVQTDESIQQQIQRGNIRPANLNGGTNGAQ